jgi:hypothetical protein
MSVGVMEDYKLRDLRASHTLGWSWRGVWILKPFSPQDHLKKVNFGHLINLFLPLEKVKKVELLRSKGIYPVEGCEGRLS